MLLQAMHRKVKYKNGTQFQAIGLSGTRPRLKIYPHISIIVRTLTHINIPILLVFMQDVCQMNLV